MIRPCAVATYCCWCLLLQGVVLARMQTAFSGDTLAEVGGKVITGLDLIERTGLIPWPGKDNVRQRDSAKVKALQSLVAEQIMATEALVRGLGNDSTLRRRIQGVEKLMVRDELYKREVKLKVNVSQQEIRQGLKRYRSQVKVLMIGTSSIAAAREISTSLRSGGRIDSIIGHPPRSLPVTTDTVTVNFGLLAREQEDAVYALDERAPTSGPLNVPRLGWVVLHLLEKKTNPEYAKRSIPERSQVVTQIARTRNEIELAGRYNANVLAPLRAVANPSTFDLFAGTVHRMLSADSLLYRNEAGYRLDALVDAAEVHLKAHLGDILVEAEGGALTVADVLESYRTFSAVLPNLDGVDFRQRLNASIKEVVAREFMARAGYRQHLDKTEAVQHDVGTWSNYWLAEKLGATIARDVMVSNEEVVEHLVRNANVVGQNHMVNVREILSDSLREALAIAERIVGGADMTDLARKFSKRKEWAEHGGESGFFVVSDHPQIGFHALESEVGALAGPIRVATGYSVFSVLGKRQLSPDSTISYDSLKALFRNALLAEKTQAQLNAFVASAAKKYRVRLHYDRLKTVEIMPANMVTRRFIGFGGSMLAVPSLSLLWQWVGESKDVQEIFP